MSEFKKIYCAYHQKEFITNFCLESSCILPLCPECICSHNDLHNANQTEATYSSIDNVLSHSLNSMLSLIKSFQAEQDRIGDIVPVISSMPKALLEKIQIAKGMAIEEIQQAFNKLEKQMMSTLAAKQTQLAGKDCCYITQAFESLNDSLNHLNKRVKSLNSQKCLASVITFIEKQHQQYMLMKTRIQDRINQLQSLQPHLNINQKILEHITPLLKKFISLQFKEDKAPTKKNQSLDSIQESMTQQSHTYKQSYQLKQYRELKEMKNYRDITPRITRSQCKKLDNILNVQQMQIITTKRQRDRQLEQRASNQQLQKISKKLDRLRKNYQNMGGWMNKI